MTWCDMTWHCDLAKLSVMRTRRSQAGHRILFYLLLLLLLLLSLLLLLPLFISIATWTLTLTLQSTHYCYSYYYEYWHCHAWLHLVRARRPQAGHRILSFLLSLLLSLLLLLLSLFLLLLPLFITIATQAGQREGVRVSEEDRRLVLAGASEALPPME